MWCDDITFMTFYFLSWFQAQAAFNTLFHIVMGSAITNWVYKIFETVSVSRFDLLSANYWKGQNKILVTHSQFYLGKFNLPVKELCLLTVYISRILYSLPISTLRKYQCHLFCMCNTCRCLYIHLNVDTGSLGQTVFEVLRYNSE